MPLLQCTAFISPRTAEPLLSLYKSSLMHYLYLAIKNVSLEKYILLTIADFDINSIIEKEKI